MSNEFNSLFATSENNQESTTGNRSLAGTAKLTSTASTIANTILSSIANEVPADLKPLLAASREDHGAMDQFIAATYDLNTVDTAFINECDEPTINGMLKSQQSKRSRAKSKDMTLDNYRTMLTAAIAENLIRLATGQRKQSSGRRVSDSLVFTQDELDELANDQHRLRAEIRNVQSKKSIYKKTEGFSEESERWQQLLEAEAQLKAIRTEVPTTSSRVDATKESLASMLGEVDLAALKAADSKELLAKIQDLIK